MSALGCGFNRSTIAQTNVADREQPEPAADLDRLNAARILQPPLVDQRHLVVDELDHLAAGGQSDHAQGDTAWLALAGAHPEA